MAEDRAQDRDEHRNMNLDPITREAGAHPIGVGVGSAAGAVAAGAAAGALAGPVGMAVGGVAGAVAGGLAGKSAGEVLDRTGSESGYESGSDGGFAADRHSVLGAERARGSLLADGFEADSESQADSVETLNDLMACCRDGEEGFKTSAEQAKSPEIRTALASRAQDCKAAGAELRGEILALGGEPEESGSAAGALHRGWVAVKSALSTRDDKALLEECERGEDAALARYKTALATSLPSNLRAIVQRQCDGVERNHASIKALRDGRRLLRA